MSNSPLQTPVQYVKGVGPKLAKIFARLGVNTIEDVFYLLPRDWEDRRLIKPIVQVRPADSEIIKGEIIKVHNHQTRNRFSILKVILSDRTASIQAVWFNQPYLEKLFRPGMKLIVSGKVEISPYEGILQVAARDYEIDTGDNLKIVPRYPLTEGLYPKKVRAVVKTVLGKYLRCVTDVKLREVIGQLHQPETMEEIAPARDYLAFEELLNFQLGLLLQRKHLKEELCGRKFEVSEEMLRQFTGALPFKLTTAQERVISEIAADLASGRPMNRLLQGDVGSGKTIVAALGVYVAIRNGCQAAILAPTEILAAQHYKKITALFESLGLKTSLITASTKSSRKVVDDLVVGTHALLEEKVKFRDLGLVVIDEQHRFGVHQRAKMIEKGSSPHLLVMTATPIPRSLALTLYGDLDRSIIDELPPGRTPAKTYFVPEGKRGASYEFIRAKMKEGRQVFVVCPLVDESAELDLKAAQEEAQRLQREIFPEFQVGLIHGRLSGAEKDGVMNQFLKGEINLLVSTTVIEVGIDVPNATVMVIEHAERFGLSQLHQLRGRIGRGGEESFCFLVGEPKTPEARGRVKAMLETSDGFAIAEADLRLRGPGEMLGARQSGLPNFRVADIIRDEKILLRARAAALELIEKDPESARHRWQSQREKTENSREKLEHSAFN